jgi:hypothetical protein
VLSSCARISREVRFSMSHQLADLAQSISPGLAIGHLTSTSARFRKVRS